MIQQRRNGPPRFGMTDFVNPSKVDGDLVAHLVELTGGGADYSFDATGNVERDAPPRWNVPTKVGGNRIIIGVAPAGAEISTRPFQLVTGRVWRGTAFGGASRPHRRPEDRRLVHGRQDRDRPDDHPQADAGSRSTKGFDLMHEGRKHPQRWWSLLIHFLGFTECNRTGGGRKLPFFHSGATEL